MRRIWSERLLFLTLFLLPWQTRWIFFTPSINNDPSQYGQISLYATQVLILIVLVLRGRPLYRPSMQWIIQAAYFFLAAAFFSLGASSFFHVGLGHVLHLLFAFALFSLLCDTRTSYKASAIAFLTGMLAPILLGFYQAITGTSPASSFLGLATKEAAVAGTAVVQTGSHRLLRAYATFPHPNIFGGYLAVSFVIFAWLIRLVHSKKTLWLALVTVMLISTAFFLAFSRGAWLALIFAVISLLILMKRRHKTLHIKTKPVIIFGLSTMLVMLIIFYGQVFSRLTSDTRIERLSIEQRTSDYGRFDDVLRHNPLLGVGPASYSFALSKINPGGSVWSYQPIHNVYLLLLCELGVVGFLALLYLLIRIDQFSSAAASTAGGMLGLCLGILLLVLGLFDHYLWSLWPGLALAAISFSFIVNWATDSVPLTASHESVK